MSKHVVTIGRWQYLKPDLCPDKEGNVVIIHKSSVAPSEIYEWGINVEKQAYERYQWCEDDFYDDGSYYHRISKKGLIEQIDKAIDLFVKEGFPDFANAFRNIKCILVCGDK